MFHDVQLYHDGSLGILLLQKVTSETRLCSFRSILGHLAVEIVVHPGCIQASHVVCHLHDIMPHLFSFVAAELRTIIPRHVVGILHDVIRKSSAQEAHGRKSTNSGPWCYKQVNSWSGCSLFAGYKHLAALGQLLCSQLIKPHRIQQVCSLCGTKHCLEARVSNSLTITFFFQTAITDLLCHGGSARADGEAAPLVPEAEAQLEALAVACSRGV